MKKFPIIVWIHSPIGYEILNSIKEVYSKSLIFAISARNISMNESIFAIGQPGLYQFENQKQRIETPKIMQTALEDFIKKHQGYTLLIPQSAQPYIKLLIDSEYCKGYAYYDEGSACYGNSFITYTNNPVHKYKLNPSKNFISLCEFLNVDLKKMNNSQPNGVLFYDIHHPKYKGCFSYFENAFPGMVKNIFSIPKNPDYNLKCSKYSLILIGNLLGRSRKSTFETMRNKHLDNIEKEIRNNPELNWVIKPHPADDDSISNLITSQLNIISWDDFCKRESIHPASEPAFLGFQKYASQDNSTILYLRNQNLNNFTIIE
jgi:hypothetical protein